MRNRIALVVVLLALVLSGCGGVLQAIGGPSDSVSIRDPWTEDDLSSALQTINEWEAVWNEQADYSYRMTVSHDGDPVYSSDWDADGSLISEMRITDNEFVTVHDRSIEAVFESIRESVDLLGDLPVPTNDGHRILWEFDSETGAPIFISCSGIDFECVTIEIDVTPL